MNFKENECLDDLRKESELHTYNFKTSSEVIRPNENSELILGWDEEASLKQLARQKTTNSSVREKTIVRARTPVTQIFIKIKPKSRENNRKHLNYVNLTNGSLNIRENSSEYASRYFSRFKRRSNIQKMFTLNKKQNEFTKENLQKNIVINSVLAMNDRKCKAKVSFLKSNSPLGMKKFSDFESSLRRTREFMVY
jgi:hypothetical protein